MREEKTTLDAVAREKLARLEREGLKRVLKSSPHGPGLTVTRDGRTLIDFCSNDYLGLSQDSAVKEAAIAAVRAYGAGAAASRLVTGNHPLLSELETRLAAFKGAETALVFGSGYLTNLGVIPALMGEGDAIFADELAHACLMSGMKLSGAAPHVFRHNDMDDLARLLERERHRARHALILTDGVFSMDGDLAPLPRLMALARAHDAWVMVDDAHGLGVIGGGKGSAAHWGIAPDIQMGTLSKSLGAYGGYVAASRAVIDFLTSRARTLVYATGLPPAAVGAALKALEIVETDAARVAEPLRKARLFTAVLNLPPAESAIVPVVLGDPRRVMEASAALEQEGFLVAGIRPPTVPQGTARLRITFAAIHRDDDVRALAAAIRRMGLLRDAA